jgi:hypothetical protein
MFCETAGGNAGMAEINTGMKFQFFSSFVSPPPAVTAIVDVRDRDATVGVKKTQEDYKGRTPS